MSGYNRDLQLPRMDLQMKVQAGGTEPPTAAYIFVGDMIKISTYYKEHYIMTVSNPDSSETKPYICLLGKLSQDPPEPHLVHPQKSIPLTAPSQLLCFPCHQPDRKQSDQSWSMGGWLPFLFCCSITCSWTEEGEKSVSYSSSWLYLRSWRDYWK